MFQIIYLFIIFSISYDNYWIIYIHVYLNSQFYLFHYLRKKFNLLCKIKFDIDL